MFEDMLIDMLKQQPGYKDAHKDMSDRLDQGVKDAWDGVVQRALEGNPLAALELMTDPRLPAVFRAGFGQGAIWGMIALSDMGSHGSTCECAICKLRRNV